MAKAGASTGHGRLAALPPAPPSRSPSSPGLAGHAAEDRGPAISIGKQPAAIVTYGQHLGAIVVIERKSERQRQAAKPAGRGGGFVLVGLPSVSIKGATGTEIATALGTLIKFDRNGVSYVVVGSVGPAAAELAASGL